MDIVVSVGEHEVDEHVKFAVEEGIGKAEQELGREVSKSIALERRWNRGMRRR